MKRHGRWFICLLVGLAAGCAQVRPRGPVNPDQLAVRARLTLVNAMDDPSPLIRAHAIEALGEAGQSSSVQYVLMGLSDKYWGVRFAACMAVLRMRYEPAKGLLVEKTRDPNRSVQAAAAGALHVLGDQQYTSILGDTLFDKDPVVRRNTAMVLGRMGEPAANKLLKRARLRDKDLSVKLQVLEAMTVLGDRRSQRLMLNYCRSGYDDEIALAVLALGQANCQEAREQIVYVFEDSSRSGRLGMRLLSARALAMLGDERGREDARGALGYRRSTSATVSAQQIRHLAALALAAMPDPDDLPYLGPLLDDPDPDVRIAGALAILKSAEKTAAAAPPAPRI